MFNPGQTAYAPPFPVATSAVNSAPGMRRMLVRPLPLTGRTGRNRSFRSCLRFQLSVGNYVANLSGSRGFTATYLAQGLITSLAPAAADMGPFNISVQMPEPLTWNNQNSVSECNQLFHYSRRSPATLGAHHSNR